MPTNNLILPYILPLHFTKLTPDTLNQYRSKHLDTWQFEETILPWEQQTRFLQAWQTDDNIRLQLQSNYGPVNLKMFTCEGEQVYDQNFQQMQQNADDPTLFIYQADLALNPFDEGRYYLKISIGAGPDLYLVSNRFDIKEEVEDSLLIEYKHRQFYQDTIFETGYSPSVRIPATIKMRPPLSKDTVFEDQELNMTMLKSIPYRIWKLFIGGSEGIPDWMADRLNRIFGCSTLKIDGRLYTKSDGAKMEENTEENYPLRGWSIELREKLNRGSQRYEDDVEVPAEQFTIVTVNTKGFSETSEGGSEFQIEDIN